MISDLIPTINIQPTLGRILANFTKKLITLPRNRWRLFDIYFAYTHCWFPICEKHDVLKLSYSYPEHGLLLSASMTSSGDHAELWSILALASLQDTSCESDACAPLDGKSTLYAL